MESNNDSFSKNIQVFDDFQIFRSEIGRTVKKMLNNSELRGIFYIRRNFQRSPARQIEYVIEYSSTDRLIDVSQLANKGFATPVAPDFPEVEEKPSDIPVEEQQMACSTPPEISPTITEDPWAKEGQKRPLGV